MIMILAGMNVKQPQPGSEQTLVPGSDPSWSP
jgi:hypothetical protein